MTKAMKTASQHPKMAVKPMMKAWLALQTKPLEMMNIKMVRALTQQSPTAMIRKPKDLAVMQKGQPPRVANFLGI